MSNAGPLKGTQPQQPLNKLEGMSVDQALALTISPSVTTTLKGLLDLVLYVEYQLSP
jgi:hypothetical protein